MEEAQHRDDFEPFVPNGDQALSENAVQKPVPPMGRGYQGGTRRKSAPQNWFIDPTRDWDSEDADPLAVDPFDLEPLDFDDTHDSLAEVSVLSGLLGNAPGGRLEWQTRALCAQTDPEAFFPEKGGSTREAKKVCASCEVRDECLEYALENDERFGIWGGLSEMERRRIRKRLA